MQPTTKKDQGGSKDVHQFADKAKDVAHNVADTTKDAAHQAGSAVSSAASAVGKKADEWTTAAGKKAEEWTAAAGNKVESLADTIRDKGPAGQGMLGKANEAVASTVERTGEYLQDKNLHGMMNDMTDLIKRNPIPALLVGLGVGYLLGRSMRS